MDKFTICNYIIRIVYLRNLGTDNSSAYWVEMTFKTFVISITFLKFNAFLIRNQSSKIKLALANHSYQKKWNKILMKRLMKHNKEQMNRIWGYCSGCQQLRKRPVVMKINKIVLKKKVNRYYKKSRKMAIIIKK